MSSVSTETQTPVRIQKENFTMTTEQNKAIVRRFFEAFEANDEAAMKEVLAPDMVANTLGVHGTQSREEMLQNIRMWNATFGDTRFEILEQIAEGDTVVTRLVFRSTHSKAEFQGIAPTGRQTESASVSIERIKDGKIVERWTYGDRSSMWEQLGLVPSPQPAR
jgi:predicted ester cyclase